MLLFRFYSSFGTLAVVAVVNGVVGSTCQTLLAVVVIDMLGLQRLPKVLGLVLLVQAVWASLNHPWIGREGMMTPPLPPPPPYPWDRLSWPPSTTPGLVGRV